MGKVLILKDGLKGIKNEEFKDNLDIEEIIIPDSVEQIGDRAFEGCTNLKRITLSNNLKLVGEFAFNNCASLEEITMPDSLSYYSYGLFKDCKSLKRLNNPKRLSYIDDYALSGCTSLLEFTIPETTTSIGHKALYGSSKIKKIHIPKNTTNIEIGAFSNMASLEKITVDEENEKYRSDEDVALIDKEGLLLQYAIGSPKEEYIVGYYPEKIGTFDGEEIKTISLTYNIANYAFENAKNVKKIYIPSELESIGTSSFTGCDNLDTISIYHSNYGAAFLTYTHKFPNEKVAVPFKKIQIENGITTLCGNTEDIFSNAEEVILPPTLESINEKVFTKSKNLKRLVLPPTVKSISPNTFHDNTTLVFSDYEVPATNFNMLQTKTELEYYLRNNQSGNVRIFSLKDGTYYVQIKDYETIKITKKEIDKLSKTSNKLENDPDKLISFIINLLQINGESHNVLQGIWLNPEMEELFTKFATDYTYIEEIANRRIAKIIKEIIESSGIKDEFLFSAIIMRKIGKEDLIKILNNYSESLSRFIRMADFDDKEDLDIDKLIAYCNLLEKYQRYDRFFYNPVFYKNVSQRNQELLIKYYNKNIKILLNNSKTLDDTYGQNLNDLLNLCNVLGVFTDDGILSQKTTTFMSEKIVNENVPNPVVGDRIHTIFTDLVPREEIDYEFIKFFLENYETLLEEEKKTSGITSRIYNSFRQISKTSTSHRGEQRHLKVTLDKCLDYFLLSKFDGVTEENKPLAAFLQKFYSEKEVLQVAEEIIKESNQIGPNIFDGENLKEEARTNSFTYEWLPRQDYENLVLGKYCNCCAHILGAGAGIMRASMTNEDSQNLVIRNKEGEIIGKMTIYVNRKEGYAVYNTAEINVNYHSNTDLKEIYKAFMRGTKDFVKRYNETNKVKIKEVTIGEYRNVFKDNILKEKTSVLPTPNYSEYAYYVGNKLTGNYNGDNKNGQLLVYKKEI